MGGGWNGCFWGAPILHLFVEKCFIFQGFGQNRGAPKTAVPTTTHPIPQLTPSDSLKEIFCFCKNVLFESCATTLLQCQQRHLRDRKRISRENLGHTMKETKKPPRKSLTSASRSKRSQLSKSCSIYWEFEWRSCWQILRRILGIWLADFLANSAARFFFRSGGFCGGFCAAANRNDDTINSPTIFVV